MTTELNYKELYEEALYHLHCVSGSRNSFTPEAQMALSSLLESGGALRHPEVEILHQNAARFVSTHPRSSG